MDDDRGSASTGIFHDRNSLEEALEQLAEHGVPRELIEVALVDDHGFHRRRVRARRGAGALHGMLSGLFAGVVVGAPVFVFLAGGQPGAGSDGALPALIDAALRGAAVGGVLGVPLGAAVGLVRAGTSIGVSDEDWEEGAVLVTVRSTEWADTARSILARAGAARVS